MRWITIGCTGAAVVSFFAMENLSPPPGDPYRYPTEVHMRISSIVLIFFIAFACTASAEEGPGKPANAEKLRLFNPGVFGKTPSDPITLLLPDTDGIQPEYIQVDLQDGEYSAAMITYGKIDFEIGRGALNARYKKFELADFANDSDFALWRNTKGKFAIQLTLTDDARLRIVYLRFGQSPEHVLEAMKEAGALDGSEPD